MTPPLFASALFRLRARWRPVLAALVLGYTPLYLASLVLVVLLGSPVSTPASPFSVGLVAALLVLAWFGLTVCNGAAVLALAEPRQPLPQLLRRVLPILGTLTGIAALRTAVTVLAGLATFGLGVPLARWVTAGWVPAVALGDPLSGRIAWRRWPHLLAGASVLATGLWAVLVLDLLLSWGLVVRQVARVDGPRLDLATYDVPTLLVCAGLGFLGAEAVRLATVTQLVDQVRNERLGLDLHRALESA